MRLSILPIGNHAPNLRMLSNSCYLVLGANVPIILDLGFKTFDRLVSQIESRKLDISKMIIIVSHGHFDHCADLIKLGKYLRSNNISGVRLFIPKDNKWFRFIYYLYHEQFEIIELTEKTVLKSGSLKITFAKTDHCNARLSSYAIKLRAPSQSFVYTSDICSVDTRLENFVKNVDNVIVDSGNPYQRIHLKGYHGNTDQITSKLNSLNVKNIYITHLKGGMSDEVYLSNAVGNCYIVKEGKSIQAFNFEYRETNLKVEDKKVNVADAYV